MQEDLREVAYQPIPVRSLLVEMKDLSELMIDLAYSAVMFNDRDLAEEVMEMEKRVDYLGYLLLMNASLAVRDKNDAEQIVSIMKTASSANKISDAAADIMEQMMELSRKHPGAAITAKTIISSMKQHMRTSATMYHGVSLDKKQMPELLSYTREVDED